MTSAADGAGRRRPLDRLRDAMLKPTPTGEPPVPTGPAPGVEDIELSIRYADDNERLIGLVAGPLAAVVALLIGDHSIQQARPVLVNGKANPLHGHLGTYEALLASLLVLSVLVLTTAWFRKRLFLGIALALFGLSVFNLRWWGFGFPFILAGAWYLVRAYRLHQDLKWAQSEGGVRPRSSGPRRPPRQNKRYTPPR